MHRQPATIHHPRVTLTFHQPAAAKAPPSSALSSPSGASPSPYVLLAAQPAPSSWPDLLWLYELPPQERACSCTRYPWHVDKRSGTSAYRFSSAACTCVTPC